EGLTQAWRAHKGESLERWNCLMHIAQTLKKQQLSEQQRLQAQQMTHSLAGTLGTFGLMEGYRLALQIEQLLQPESAFSEAQISQFHTLVTTLGHALDDPPQLVPAGEDTAEPSTLLIVDVNNVPYIQQLIALAVAQGFETSTAASIEIAFQALALDSSPARSTEPIAHLPDLVLINLVAGEADPVLDEPILQMLLGLITKLTERWPQLPVLVVTPQADFGNRLDLIRRGGAIVLEYPVVPVEVLDVINHATHNNYRHSKIMIVDDDTHYLKQVIHLLQPWNFQITPLADPQRFWTLFTQVMPDLLILDIEMPRINGFELCQVLRSNPQWQHLPIIFLSIHNHPAKQDQAFTLGADDYITKPVQGKDLALRLVNRLKRYQAWQRWQKATEMAS
ncbi:MAG: response regulator, partial [Cyanobacteria bacterium J06659_2]